MISLPIVSLDRKAPGPLYLKLKNEILRQIRLGGLRPGDRLPPTRTLAEDLGVNRGTVSAAYDELTGDGVLESHVGRGTFVAELMPLEPLAPTDRPPGYRWSDHFAGVRPPEPRVYPATGDKPVIPFHRNIPDETLFPTEGFRESLNEVLKNGGRGLLSYAPVGGHPEFLTFLQEYLHEHRLLDVAASEVLVVNGSQQALDLICRAFLRPGDTVLVEDPTYTGALEMFEAFSARPVGVPTDEGGIRLEDAERLFARERPKFIYIMPTFQNPTGHSLAEVRREAFVRLAARYEIPIVEDDFDGELYYEGRPPAPLKSVSENQGVIYIGTPSKMLFPGMRIGWIIAEEPVIERLGRIKQVADLSGSQLLPAAFARFALTGGLARHKERVRAAYRGRRDTLLVALKEHMPTGCSWTRPAGGMTLMLSLPADADFETLLEGTARDGVLFTPGPWFFVNGGKRQLRLCFGSVPDEAIEPGIVILAREVRRALERGGRPLPAKRKPSLPPV